MSSEVCGLKTVTEFLVFFVNIQRVVEYLPYDNPVGMCIYLRYMCIQNIVSWNILFNEIIAVKY